MMFRISFLLVFGIVGFCHISAQVDTVLKRVWNVGYPVSSVFNQGGDELFITGARGFEVYAGEGEFQILDARQSSPLFWKGDTLVSGSGEWYKFFNESPYEDFQHWRHHIFSSTQTFTEGWLDSNQLLVCDGARLYEFELVPTDSRWLHDCSVRGFQWVDDVLIANSYSGVWVDSVWLANPPKFNDGAILQLQDTIFSMGQYVVKWPVGQPEDRVILQYPQKLMMPDYTTASPLARARKDGVVWHDELYWYSFTGFGVYRSGEFKAYSDLNVLHVVEVENELILLTRGQGVHRFNGESFEKLDLPEGVNYFDVAKPASGPWLFATDHGLCIWRENGRRIEFLGMEDGLPSSIVCSILPDEWGTYWVSTFAGVVRYDLANGLLEHHAPLVEFNRFSKGTGPNGELAFGSTDGIHAFQPKPPSIAMASPAGLVWWVGFGAFLVIAMSSLWLLQSRRKLNRQVQHSTLRVAELEREAFQARIRELIYEDIDGISVNGIAEKFEMSRRTFYRKCTEYDLRPGVVIREIRIQTALKAMERDGISMAEAAKRVGYSPNHLRRLLDEEKPSVQET